MRVGQVVGLVVGGALMVAPAVAGYVDTPAADLHRTVGPFAMTFALIAMWDATRGVRFANFALVPVLLGSPPFVGHSTAAVVIGVAAALALAAATPVGGTPKDSLGEGWRGVFTASDGRR